MKVLIRLHGYTMAKRHDFCMPRPIKWFIIAIHYFAKNKNFIHLKPSIFKTHLFSNSWGYLRICKLLQVYVLLICLADIVMPYSFNSVAQTTWSHKTAWSWSNPRIVYFRSSQQRTFLQLRTNVNATMLHRRKCYMCPLGWGGVGWGGVGTGLQA